MDIRGAEMPAAALFNSESYVGESKDNRYHGFGRVTYANGNEYCGSFVEGRMDGLGTMLWEDGLKYVGEWRKNSASGFGCLSWLNGTEYYGEVQKGKRHGSGVQIQGNVRYCGEWVDGKRHGFGTLQSPASEYSGEWSRGKRDGWGVITFRNGNRYEGTWANDVMAGFGMMTWVTSSKWAATKDGDKIDPTSVAGNAFRDAVAKMRSKVVNVGSVSPGPLGPFTPAIMASTSVAERYIGEWKDNAPHGKGEYDFQFFNATSSREILFTTVNRYSGELIEGKRDGFGTQFYADGTIYEGEWRANMKHGKGVIIHADGSRDEVEMENDAPKSSGASAAGGAGSVRGARRATTNAKSVQDTLSIDDLLQPIDNLKEVMEVVSQHRNTLKHVYAAYCAIVQPVDFDAALEQRLRTAELVPVPKFAGRPSMASVAVPTSFTPLQRNAQLTKVISGQIEAKVAEAAQSALKRVAAAADEFTAKAPAIGVEGGGGSIDVVEGHVPTEAEIAELAENAAELENTTSSSAGGGATGGVRNGSALLAAGFGSQSPSRSGTSMMRRAATPLEGITRTAFDPPVEMAPPPPRRDRQAILSLHQFLAFLEDAAITDASCQASDVLRIIEPALVRRHASVPELSPIEGRQRRIQHQQFVEAMVRIADYKLGSTEPFFACNSIHRLTLAQRVRYLFENFVVPLSTALREVDPCPLMRELGVDPFVNDTACDSTLDELRRQAIRSVRDMSRIQSAGAGSTGATGNSAISTSNAASGGNSQSVESGGIGPVSAPDPRPLSAGADGLDFVQVPFVAPSETITTDIVGRKATTGIAAGRGSVECQLEFVVVLVKISPGHIRRKHLLIIQRIDGVSSFGGIVPEYQLERVQKLFTTAPWFAQRGLPALRPRHLLQFLPAAEILEREIAAIHRLFVKCSDVQDDNKTPKVARLGLLLDALVQAKLIVCGSPEKSTQQQPPAQDKVPVPAAVEVTSPVVSVAPQGTPPAPSVASRRPASLAAPDALAAVNAPPARSPRRSSSVDAPFEAAGASSAFLSASTSASLNGGGGGRRPSLQNGSPHSLSSAAAAVSAADAFAESLERVSLASSASIAPSQYGQLLGMLTAELPAAVRERRSDAVVRNVLFSCIMQLVTAERPQPCTSNLPPAAQQPVGAPKDPSPQLRQLYKACPELLEAVNLRAAQEASRNVAKRAFANLAFPISMTQWEVITRDIVLLFDQFMMVIVAAALLLYASDEVTDVMTPLMRIPVLVEAALQAPQSRDFLVPGAGERDEKAADVPLILPACLPVKKKPPPKEDPKAKKKGAVPARK